MKLDYELKCDIENKTVSLKINDQDERFWCRDISREDDYEFICTNGVTIYSADIVLLSYGTKDSLDIWLLGNNKKAKEDDVHFNTEQETLDYYLKVKQALEEFKAFEPKENKKTYTKEEIEEVLGQHLGGRLIDDIMRDL
jgi:hypothetical protein